MATNKSVSTALVSWEKDLAEVAAKQAAKEKPGSINKAISIRGGVLSIDEEPVEGNELRAIVLSAIHENQYYTGAFNSNVPQIPTCYSFGDPEADVPEDSMAPHAESTEAQSELCSSCWANEFGSADVGKGKACKNVRRLVLVTEDALESADALASAEARVLKVPVMSVKGWSHYVRNKLGGEINRPYWAVITKIKVVPDAKSQFKLQFGFEELVDFDQSLYDAMQKKVSDVTEQAIQPYQQRTEEVAPQRGRGSKVQPLKPVGRAAQAMAKKPVGRGVQAMAVGKRGKF